MRYNQRRQAFYSQNYLRDPKLVTKLIRNSSIGKNDIVLEIGSGKGSITRELLKAAGKVIAVEIDFKLYLNLLKRFQQNPDFNLICSDFLKYSLPDHPYKVFANIPFVKTADIIRKLATDDNFEEGYLVVQKEAAKRFIGQPYDNKNSMQAILLKPWFKINIFWKFERSDFFPRPKVDSVMINIKRLEKPLISLEQRINFRDYVLYMFNRKKISRLDINSIIQMFNFYLTNAGGVEKNIVKRKVEKIILEQQSLQKINRTRKDKGWRRYK